MESNTVWKIATEIMAGFVIGVLFLGMMAAVLWFNGGLSDDPYCPDHGARDEAEQIAR